MKPFSARNLFSALLQNLMGDFLGLWYDNHKQEKTLESQLEMGSGFEKATKEKIKNSNNYYNESRTRLTQSWERQKKKERKKCCIYGGRCSF